jgi:hypothetical protein
MNEKQFNGAAPRLDLFFFRLWLALLRVLLVLLLLEEDEEED